MHAVVGAVVAGAGIVAEEIDPTVQPVRQSFYVFVFLAVCTVLLLLSFLRHLRRAQGNLGSARAAATPGRDSAGQDSGDPRTGEGDAR